MGRSFSQTQCGGAPRPVPPDASPSFCPASVLGEHLKTPVLPWPCVVAGALPRLKEQSSGNPERRERGLEPGCHKAQPSKTPEAGRSLAHQFPSTSFLRGRGCLYPPRVRAQGRAGGKPGRCRNPGSPGLSLTKLEREVSGTCPKKRGAREERASTEAGHIALAPV